MTQSSPALSPLDSPQGAQPEVSQEVRLAIVMYGGVSLAIYINGIAQELLQLVQATAVTKDGKSLLFPRSEGTAAVYRKLGQILARAPQRKRSLKNLDADAPVRTRFVIDVISGTSAGGINGIFLAKALANGQSIKELKDLWIKEGDLGVLINDTVPPGSPRKKGPPQSWLNSQRLYLKLLAAFDGMDKSRQGGRTQGAGQKLVERVDLYVTSTDVRGSDVALRLSDNVVHERRHRNVFHFSYRPDDEDGQEQNDFEARFNPFLAYAARCTSSFPFAFEPMRLVDIDELLKNTEDYSDLEKFGSACKDWEPFFEAYKPQVGTMPPQQRSFGDGGYLDNKPFSYAIETLLRRQARVPVDRKLIYIEPSPEHPDLTEDVVAKPNVFENGLAALTLSRYETIREDLMKVIDRNRLIERVELITEDLDKDVERSREGRSRRFKPKAGSDWAGQDLREMVRYYGPFYGAYQRLKVAEVTDDLTRLIGAAIGIDESSDEFLALSLVIRAWRAGSYTAYHPRERRSTPLKPTFNRFLMDFDLAYRIRRLNFVRNKLDSLLRLNRDARKILDDNSGVSRNDFLDRLQWCKNGLNLAFQHLLTAKRTFWNVKANLLGPCIQNLKIDRADLKNLLEEPTSAARLRFARNRFLNRENLWEAFNAFARELADELLKFMRKASDQCSATLNPTFAEQDIAGRVVRKSLWPYYRYFDDYDMVTHPIFYTFPPGELATVEIIRFSPEDAKALINEKDGSSDGRRKLAGTALANFGAFLDPVWRKNDNLWGRLDGAERIITSLLPLKEDQEDRDALILEAHKAILKEEVQVIAREDNVGLLVKAMMTLAPADRNEGVLRALVAARLGAPVNEKITSMLNSCLDIEDIHSHFLKTYEVNRQVDRKMALEYMARSARVVSKMLEALSSDSTKIQWAWLSRVSQLFWGLVTVAMPGGLASLLLRNLIRLLYVFEVLAVLLGTIFTSEPVQSFGWKALLVTVFLHGLVFMLGDFVRKVSGWRSAVKIVLIMAGLSGLFALSIKLRNTWLPPMLDRLIQYLQNLRGKS